MSLIREETLTGDALKDIAVRMMIAARTAPKARGINTLVMMLAEGASIEKLASRMEEIADEYEQPFFKRDAGNILQSPVILLMGTSIKTIGLIKCGMCGYESCDEKSKHPDVPCAFNTGDLGIAVGSAVSTAMQYKVDNRIMYTVGQAALDLGFFEPEIKIVYGIPICAESKSPFFDRKK